MNFPVETKLNEIRTALASGRDVVLTAPPGSGKTTAVPPALLNEPWLKDKKIVMLEPRRLAARNCAAYISRRLSSPLGGLVGYQVRLEKKISAATRLEILTEGLLTRRVMSDPELADVGLIIFDEFHERSLNCDLAYALALDVKRALRPDLRIMVMSATLDADEVARHLDAEIIRAEGRMYPVETRYLGDISMTAAITRALQETQGDILCFLPGEGEIKKVKAALQLQLSPSTSTSTSTSTSSLNSPSLLPLYGSLPKEEQDRVFAPSPHRKVILATSIAETSLTIEGITTVIDSGLMRVPKFSPSTGMTGLSTLPLTLDRAEQRRGRAGRVQAGVCYRLWDASKEASRPKKMLPEILDADLSSTVLLSYAWGAVKRTDLPWMTPPPDSSWRQAVGLLTGLGAINTGLTDKGRKMAEMSMHPRLANMMLAGGNALYAAIIEEGSRSRETDIRYVPITPRIKELSRRFTLQPSTSTSTPTPTSTSTSTSTSTLNSPSLLALAYPDRVAKNRGNGTFTMVSGRGAFLPEDDPLAHEPYLVACELDDRPGDARIFLAAPISLNEIEALFGDQITEEPYCEWDRRDERVKAVVRRKLGAMPLEEKADRRNIDETQIAKAIWNGIRQKGIANLPCWTNEALQLRARITFLARHLGWQSPTDEALLTLLQPPTSTSTSTSTSTLNFNFNFSLSTFRTWRDLEKLDMMAVLDAFLVASGHDRRELDRLAPVRMEVPSGSHMLIHYEGEEPTCEVRLQECFGLMSTPKIAGNRVPIVMTLLSPAQRPCAVTKDLAGFWQSSYQLVRKDLRGRYPKHYWPEDPFTAVATRRVRPR